MISRRTLLQRSALLIGGTLVGADSLLAKNIDWDSISDAPEGKAIGLFSKTQVKLMNELADTILPDTPGSPGAKAAKTGQFMAIMVSDCYEPDDQKRFLEGLAKIDAASKQQMGKTFLKANKTQRTTLLNGLDKEQKDFQKTRKSGEAQHYFRVFKDLALWGYFSSEIGSTQALRFQEYPGKYTTIDYKKGDRMYGGY